MSTITQPHPHSYKARVSTRTALTSGRLRKKASPYIFITPFIIFFVAFSVYPMLFTAELSLTNWHGSGNAVWVGLGNYSYLLTNKAFWSSLANSAILWLLVLPIQLALGIVSAVLLNIAEMKFRSLYRVTFILPFVTPLVAIAQVWVVVFDERYGAVNAFLRIFGIENIGWLTTTTWAKPTLALLFLWKTTGFVVIILLSGLQSINSTLYEAAEIDGAGKVRQLFSITMPLLRPTLGFVVVMQTLGVFQMFAEPFVVTQGGPYNSTTTAGYHLYNFITRADLGTGAANSILLVVIVMTLSLLFVRGLTSKE